MISILEKEGLGLGSPNSNLHHGLITTTPAGAPGVLTYDPRLSGKVLLAPEIQGDEFQSTYGPGSSCDHPGYEYLYRRVRDDLNRTMWSSNATFRFGWVMRPKAFRAC